MEALIEIPLALDKLNNHKVDRLKKNNSMGDKMTMAKDFLVKNLEQKKDLSSNKTSQDNSAQSSGEMMGEMSEKTKMILGQKEEEEEEEEAQRSLNFFSTITSEIKNKRK